MSKIVILSVLMITTACHRIATEPNEEKVLNAKPWFFGSEGALTRHVEGSVRRQELHVRSVRYAACPQ